ncbi:MAG TPA: glycosyltransferase family 2 protein [Gemmatimonadales bacterium]|jgi:glycosyltransferase involved in cell wall biosynthesis|nr:glycosyltransferase family 2 protein [Gemmatimonadales bacterium]
MRVAVVIPAFQAAATIRTVVARTLAAVPTASVIVVDDGSTDGTVSAARAFVLGHEENLGKGAALRDGIREAITQGAAIVVTLDADGQHPPEEIPRLLAPIGEGRADLVLGARTRGGPMPVPRRLSNWLSARLASRIGGQGVTDAQTGFRAFTRAVAERVRPAEAHYDYETAFLLGALDAGFRVTSVAIPTIYDGAQSHFRPWADSWRVAQVFARYARRILVGAA